MLRRSFGLGLVAAGVVVANRAGFVGRGGAAQVDRGRHEDRLEGDLSVREEVTEATYRLVSLSSMRRLRAVSISDSGWYSP